MEEKYLSIEEAAKILNVTESAVRVMLSKKKINFIKRRIPYKNSCKLRRVIKLEDLKKYKSSKGSQDNLKVDGELIYDNSKGLYSIKQISEKFKISYSSIYYAVMNKFLKSTKKGPHWIIHIDDAHHFYHLYTSRKKTVKKEKISPYKKITQL